MQTARVPGEIHRSRLTGQFSKHRYHAPKVATFVGARAPAPGTEQFWPRRMTYGAKRVRQGTMRGIKYEIWHDPNMMASWWRKQRPYAAWVWSPALDREGKQHYDVEEIGQFTTIEAAIARVDEYTQHAWRRELDWQKRGYPSAINEPFAALSDLAAAPIRMAGEAVGVAKDTLAGTRTFLANPLTPSSTAALVVAGLVLAGGLYWLTRPKTVTPQPVGPGPAPPPAPAPSGRAIQLTEADAGTAVQAKPGDTVVISLSQDASSGYAWGLVGQPDANVVTTGPAVPTGGGSGGGVPGGTTMQISFPFIARGPGTVVVQFILARPWDPANPSRQITFTIQVS